jgi:hypothetical protein
MDLIGMHRRLRRTVDNAGYAAVFLKARAHSFELVRHKTVGSALAVLEDTTPERYAEREELTRALISELQRAPHPLWNTLLQLAYFPMLFRLRCRILGETVTGHEVDQVVVTSFLDVLHSLPIESGRDRLCMHLRQNTQRLVFGRLQKEQRVHDSFFLRNHEDIAWLAENHYEPEGDETPDQDWRCLWPVTSPTASAPLESDERAELVAFIQQFRHILSDDELELVIATIAHGEKLTVYARCLSRGKSPADEKRVYQRIKRRHSRARAKLRDVLDNRRPVFRCKPPHKHRGHTTSSTMASCCRAGRAQMPAR